MNKLFLGVDTSNYTTSLALYSEKDGFVQRRKLLSVEKNAIGLRQSDALFLHTKELPQLANELFGGSYDNSLLAAVGVSSRPRDVEGSYMPCFLAGVSFASAIAKSHKTPLYNFSHQAGHLMSGVFSSKNFSLLSQEFIFFHISGGTTELLHVIPNNHSFDCSIIGSSLDLHAGQAVDRVGVYMGLDFPSGAELDLLSQKSNKEFKPKISVKEANCSLSGIENVCKKMLDKGDSKEDTAKFLFSFLAKTIKKQSEYARDKFPLLPILYAGGVMSNSYIRLILSEQKNVYFANPSLSSDNAVGIALLAKQSYDRGVL